MKPITQWLRLWQIQRVILRHNLVEIILSRQTWLSPLVLLSKMNPWYWRRDKNLSRGENLRLALQELGPFFIKFGQLLATRRDLLPDDIADELSKLQDQVAPFTEPNPQDVVSQAFGFPLPQVFAEFNPHPLASASIAQVHTATLLDGRQVVVKILRPGIEKIIAQDLYLLKNLAKRGARFLTQGARLLAVVNEIEQTIYGELDLQREAASMAQFRRQHKDFPEVKIPAVIWSLTRRNLLVMERIHGIPLSNMAKIRTSGVDLKHLAESLIRLFFKQVFDFSYFHADLHAGNLFLAHQPLNPPHIIMVDFGIVGVLNSTDLTYLAENLHAFLHSDYQRIAELHVESGWVPADTRVDQLASAVSIVCEPILAQPLKDISFGMVMLRLLQTASQFKAQVQPQLILLQKTLITVEGLSRQIYPEVDFFHIAREMVGNWMRHRSGMRGFLHELRKRAPRFAVHLPVLPELIFNNLQASLKHKNHPLLLQKKLSKAYFWSGLGAASLVSGIILSLILLIYPVEFSVLNHFEHSLLLLVSTFCGLFGFGSLLYSRCS